MSRGARIPRATPQVWLRCTLMHARITGFFYATASAIRLMARGFRTQHNKPHQRDWTGRDESGPRDVEGQYICQPQSRRRSIEIGRASCRERESISEDAGPLKEY